MKFLQPLLLPALVLSATLGAVHLARTQSEDNELALSNYRAALDQLGAGRAQDARLLLENGQRRGEMAPESAVLLAYLEEHAGDPTRARRTLEGVAAPSEFVATYLGRLGGAATPAEIAVRAAEGGATLPTSDARIAKLEKFMAQIVNAERQRAGLDPLSYDERMASVARAHSAEMRDKKYFAHESPTPALREPLDRYVEAFGVTPRLVAENIYRAWGNRSFLSEADIRTAHGALMNSPGHRANILLDGTTKMGIGIAANGSGDIWITQLYARP